MKKLIVSVLALLLGSLGITAAPPSLAATLGLGSLLPESAFACSGNPQSKSYADPGQKTYASTAFGVGLNIFSTQTSLNDLYNDHAAYWGQIGDENLQYHVQIGTMLGAAYNYVFTSPTVFTETYNKNLYSGSTPIPDYDFHPYGTAGTDEYYYTYYDGYEDTTQNPAEYEYEYDLGSYGQHAPYPGYLTVSQSYARASGEVMQLDQSANCENLSAYFGTDNGSLQPGYEMYVGLTTQTGGWETWNSTVSTYTFGDSFDPVDQYYWDLMANFTSAYAYGS